MPAERSRKHSSLTRARLTHAPALGGDKARLTGHEPSLAADRTLPLTLSLLRDPATRDRAVNTLVKLGTAALPDLFGLFHDPDQGVRHAAAWALGRLKDRRSIHTLMQAADWSTEYLSLKKPNACHLLIDALRHGSPPSRVASAVALARLHMSAVPPDLIEQMAHQNILVRLAAIYALGMLADPLARPHLEDALDDPDPAVVWLAAWSLERIADRLG